ncbi:MAG TPA: OstA-like protein [Puia sp.]|jgi:lipopolysaccharide export system protein LptA|nr:OstA-like protein [Puia sp.]
MKKPALLLGILIFCLSGFHSLAQIAVPFKSKTGDSVHTVYIWHSDTLRDFHKDSIAIQSLYGNVKLQSDKTFFYTDSLAMNHKDNFIEAFGHVHINDNDSTDIFSDYMKYFVDTKKIIFQKNVELKDGKGTLSTDELHYDMNMHIGDYYNGGKVVNKSTTVTSREGTYYADTKDVYFKNDVKLKDPAYELSADSLLYNSDEQMATFITNTFIRDSSGRTISTRDGFYDMKNHRAHFTKRATITDKGETIIADNIAFDDSTGISTAQGNAVFRDTVQNLTLISNLMIADKKANTFLATQKPLIILKQDKDSIYITGDTVYSAPIPDSVLKTPDSVQGMAIVRTAKNPNDSSLRYLQIYHHVRIYSDSLQAVADSVYYSGLDSIFRLFINPVAWAGGYQITGDTMFLYTKNKKPDRLYVFENSLVVGKSYTNMYNQIKGNTLNGYFKDGVIDYMRSKGSAEAVYYIKDDSMALVGVNRVNKADIIDMIFLNKQLNKVVLRQDADGIMYPIKKVNLDEMKLRNFKWLEDRRPKTKYELFDQSLKPKA